MSDNKNATPAQLSFIDKILNLFTSQDPEVIKRKKLKLIAKNLHQTRYKFYKFSGEEALPTMAKYFYEMYRVLAPLQLVLRNQQNPQQVKRATISNFYTDRQREIDERLTEEHILEAGQKVQPAELSKMIKDDLQALYGDFTKDKVDEIDEAYTMFMRFTAFCNFDFYFMLKKFDSNLQEQVFSTPPRFDAIRAEYIKEDLADFAVVAAPILQPTNWANVFTILKRTKGIEPPAGNTWNKILNRINDFFNSSALEMLLQLLNSDPFYQLKYDSKTEHIVDAHLEKIRNDAESLIRKIQNEKENSKINDLLTQLYGTTAVIRLKNYVEQRSVDFERRSVGSFTYFNPLSYLKAFLLDYFKKDIREISDLVLVRGQWSIQSSSTTMSNAYHALLEISNQITAFDDSLGEGGEVGTKFKTLIPRSGRDKEASRILRGLVRTANESAKVFLVEAANNFVIYARHLKLLIEDKDKTRPELLANWKELDAASDDPIRDLCIAAYKKIFLFISLMQMYLTKEED